ncbi:ethanolamine utilization protein EutH [Bacillus sp. SG-1]|uniref:ethanolamine utilization protein EutH n=1 Tax=Bacillus sp. SG-1 TaxID=161544 RepID=UPI0009FD3F1C
MVLKLCRFSYLIYDFLALLPLFVLGSHLGFVAAVDKEYLVPMIVGKLTAGILAALIAYLATRKRLN